MTTSPTTVSAPPLHADGAPRMVLGTMYFGTRVDEATSHAVLDRYVEAGGEWIDTADNYAFWQHDSGLGGQSEAVLGRWFRANAGAPVKVSTKVGAQPTRPGGFPDSLEGLAPGTIADTLTNSLDVLGLDAVDLYWAHLPDDSVPFGDQVDAFAATVAAGRVRAWGLSNHPVWQVERARAHAASVGATPPAAIQQRWSYLQPRPGAPVDGIQEFGMLTPEGIDYVDREQMTAWVYSPLLLGAYDRADRPVPDEYECAGTDRRLAALDRVASATGCAPGQVVLAWIARRSSIVPLVGVSTVEQLDAALDGVALELDDAQLSELDGVH